MSTMEIIVLAAVVVLGIIVAVVIARSVQKSRHEDAVAKADHIRQRADEHTIDLKEEDARAREAEARAEQARVQAERAERQAAEARTGVAQEQARQEDQLRAADRLDPRVDHKADDYTPRTDDPDTILDDDHGTSRTHAADDSTTRRTSSEDTSSDEHRA